ALRPWQSMTASTCSVSPGCSVAHDTRVIAASVSGRDRSTATLPASCPETRSDRGRPDVRLCRWTRRPVIGDAGCHDGQENSGLEADGGRRGYRAADDRADRPGPGA